MHKFKPRALLLKEYDIEDSKVFENDNETVKWLSKDRGRTGEGIKLKKQIQKIKSIED